MKGKDNDEIKNFGPNVERLCDFHVSLLSEWSFNQICIIET